jgi:SAM-dependent methyltransferase
VIYSAEKLADLPDSVVEAAAGCGDPTAIAALSPGETVLDLGSGGGIDVFLAAKKVGASGHVIGVDMTPDMIRLARENAKKIGADNVEFRLGELEHLPVETGTVDVVISNCVINLSPDKDAVFAEAYRVLKPGGRLCVSDMVVDRELPEEVRSSMEAWASCVAGALEENVYLDKVRQAGFVDVKINSAAGIEFSGFTVTSLKVKAQKPA